MPIVNGLGETNEFDHTVDDAGNVQVDFVWGNFPLQPDDDRGMNTLDPTLDNHEIATTGWSNFPGYIPNYEGDGDVGLETVVPNFVGLSIGDAIDAANGAGVELNWFNHYLTASYIESTGKTVRVTAYDTDYGNWSNSANAALAGLKNGDELDLSQLVNNSEVNFGLSDKVKVTAVNNDGSNSWFEFKSSTELNLDEDAAGTIYASYNGNLDGVITVQRPNQTAPGAIVNLWRWVNTRFIGTN